MDEGSCSCRLKEKTLSERVHVSGMMKQCVEYYAAPSSSGLKTELSPAGVNFMRRAACNSAVDDCCLACVMFARSHVPFAFVSRLLTCLLEDVRLRVQVTYCMLGYIICITYYLLYNMCYEKI